MSARLKSSTQDKTILLVCMVAHALVTLCFAITLHYELKTSGRDLVSFEQPLFNLLHGNGFTSSVNYPFVSQHWFGYHFSPILYLLVPFYYLFPHVEMFLTIGSIAIAAAAWPIYLTALKILDNSRTALVFALLYLINPFVINGASWNFHEVSFAPLCISWMLWALVHQNKRMMLILCAVLLSIKEHYGLSIFGFGLLWAWHWRDYKFGAGLCALGTIAMGVILGVVMPHYNPTGAVTMTDSASEDDRYSWLFSKKGLDRYLMEVIMADFWYVMKLLLPFLLLPLGAFVWLMPIASDFLANGLTYVTLMRSIISYHDMPIIPVVVIACCQMYRRISHHKKAGDVMLALVMGTFCFNMLFTALPYSLMGNLWEFSTPRFDYTAENRKALEEINRLIPKDAPVSAQMNVLPHLQSRLKLIPYPELSYDSQYIVLHLSTPFKKARYVVGMPFSWEGTVYLGIVDELLADKHWGVIYVKDRWVVLQKDAKSSSQNQAAARDALSKITEEYNELKKKASHKHNL